MTVITGPDQFNVPDLFVDLAQLLGRRILLKCEGLNFAGSVKLKAAVAMLDRAERSGALSPGDTLVESSSGNLGIALSMAAASRGYGFICVTDARCNPLAINLMRTLGATVEVISAVPDPGTTLLAARIARVREVAAQAPDRVWLNQYENPANWQAHEASTGPEILAALDHVDFLVVGVGTSGTAMGCARYLRRHSPRTRIVGVDSVGSVSFGGPSGVRHIPGLGSGVCPPLLDTSLLDDVVLVDEVDTVRVCRTLSHRGFLFGGSTGTVLAGADRWLAEHGRTEDVTVALAPDMGERYLDTIYDDGWVAERYGAGAALPVVGHRRPEPV